MINKLRVHRKWYILSMDVVLSCIAFYFAFLIIGLGEIPPERMPLFLQALCVMAGVRLLAYSVSNLYKGILRYAQIVPELTEEPDYDAALAALKKLLG